MKTKVKLWGLLFMAAWLSSCVDEYKLPKNIADFYQQEVMIEGRILSGAESVFYVTKTVPLDDNSKITEYVTDAQVHIIGQNGYRSEQAVLGKDSTYTVSAGDLPLNTLYAVEVVVDGDVYQSVFQPILQTPEIDDISYKELDGEISLLVSTHNDDESARCYMWTYEEDWEFHASMDMFHTDGYVMYNEDLYPKKDNEWNPYYYCWGHDKSTSINIYSTEELSANNVVDHELFRRRMDDIRISYIYSLLLNQVCLTTEAYEYYRLMKLYTEESDGLFTPMPSDVRGNITCVSNPEKTVRGLVIASNVVEKRIFVYAADFKKNVAEPDRCSLQIPPVDALFWERSWQSLIESGYVAVHEKEGVFDVTSSLLYSPSCVNCMEEPDATKKRPAFWPNSHE